jgi:ubiquinone biosynthesis protein UbiJ
MRSGFATSAAAIVGVAMSKSYTITTDDDKKLTRAIQADSIAMVLADMDNRLRNAAKHSQHELAAQSAEEWRTILFDCAHIEGICIDSLFD